MKIEDIEIARYITPYGIQFDLGPNGFSWIYDVTDYQNYLKDTVDLRAHNTQELLDLKFAFIEGIPLEISIREKQFGTILEVILLTTWQMTIIYSAKSIKLLDTSDNIKLKQE